MFCNQSTQRAFLLCRGPSEARSCCNANVCWANIFQRNKISATLRGSCMLLVDDIQVPGTRVNFQDRIELRMRYWVSISDNIQRSERNNTKRVRRQMKNTIACSKAHGCCEFNLFISKNTQMRKPNRRFNLIYCYWIVSIAYSHFVPFFCAVAIVCVIYIRVWQMPQEQ